MHAQERENDPINYVRTLTSVNINIFGLQGGVEGRSAHKDQSSVKT